MYDAIAAQIRDQEAHTVPPQTAGLGRFCGLQLRWQNKI
jgi:hypothetical protein